MKWASWLLLVKRSKRSAERHSKLPPVKWSKEGWNGLITENKAFMEGCLLLGGQSSLQHALPPWEWILHGQGQPEAGQGSRNAVAPGEEELGTLPRGGRSGQLPASVSLEPGNTPKRQQSEWGSLHPVGPRKPPKASQACISGCGVVWSWVL